MGRTPEEIKKGLERCMTMTGCANCPYRGEKCALMLSADALAYIQQLEEKVSKLEKRCDAEQLNATYAITELEEVKRRMLRNVEIIMNTFPKWISVEDRLPDREGEYIVIVQLPDGKQERMWDIFHPYKGWCEDSGDGKIVYWMSFDSLPEPPKEG